MNITELVTKPATEQRKALLNKEVSAVELTQAVYKNIEVREEKIGAYNSLTRDFAIETAKKVDEKIRNGEETAPLAGIPLALKDNINLKDSLTTASSKILANFVSPYDATVTKKLKENLIPVIGKANMDEFAMGSSTENSATKITRNPWNLNKVPGGSSGGSAAAVAAGEATIALGSETGGSVRLPASFCGLVGLKPTYGRVSRYGLIAFASSLDQIGPFGRTVEDTALLLQAIAGHDEKDSTSLPAPVADYTKDLRNDLKGVKIGYIKELCSDGLQEEVSLEVQKAIKTYRELGAEVVEISLPLIKYAVSIYYVVATAEASSNLARFDGVKYGFRAKDADNLYDMYVKTRAQGFGDEVKRRIMLGTYALSSGYYDAYYKKAQQVRRLVKNDFDTAFQKVDVLLSPTCPYTAFDIGSKIEDPLSMYLTDIATITANLAGIPAMSVPVGLDKSGMPIGLQLQANSLNEAKMLNVAFKLEEAVQFNYSTPSKTLV